MEIKPVDLYFEEVGQGLPIVLVHGFPLNHTIWQPVVDRIANKARFILPDLRGYGKSPETDGGYSMRTMAEDLLALIDRLKLEKVVLVGHSMGGYISLAFAYAYPHRLAGLGLVATQANADSPERRQARLITAREIKTRGVKYIANGMPAKLTHSEELQSQLHDLIGNERAKTMINSLKGMAERPDATEWLGTIEVPTLVVHGGQDQLIPAERSHTMTQLLNKSWLVEIPEAGHMPMMETPDRVAEAFKKLICASTGC